MHGFTYDPHGWEDSFDLEAGDANDDTYCEGCDGPVDYSNGTEHGTCACDVELELDDDAPESCPLCGGFGTELGRLGRLTWHRCRDCGMDFSTEAPAPAPRPLLLVTTAHPSLEQHTLDGERHPHLGRLIQPRHTSSIEATAEAGIEWAADNDCFQSLDEAAYVRMLDRIEGLPGCRFVTVPDVVGDAPATLALFEKWAPELERRGLPVALVAQDGLEYLRWAIQWDRIDALFIGGSTEWKESAAARELADEARARGKWVHWGRVNTYRRFELVVADHGDSFDGSKFARFRKTYLDTGLEWCRAAAARPTWDDSALEALFDGAGTVPALDTEREVTK